MRTFPQACIGLLGLSAIEACSLGTQGLSGGHATATGTLSESAGTETSSMTTSLDSTSNSTSGSDMPCEASTHTCVDPPPRGWVGPLLVFSTAYQEPLPSCILEYPKAWEATLSDLQPGESVCDCSCQPSEAECTTASVSCFTDRNCTEPSGSTQLNGTCKLFSCPDWYVVDWDLPPDACVPTKTESIPGATWENHVQICELETFSQHTCTNGRVCVPKAAPPWKVGCIVAAGDIPCPSPEYPFRKAIFAGMSDTRDCDTCTCEVDCLGGLGLWQSTNCTMNGQSAIKSTCLSNADSMLASGLATGSGPPTCSPKSNGLVGDVVGTGPSTVCCP